MLFRSLLVPSLGSACAVTVGIHIVSGINSGLMSGVLLRVLIGLPVVYCFAAASALLVGFLFRYLAKRWHLGRAWVAIAMGVVVGILSILAIDFTVHRIPELSSIHVPSIAYVQFGVVGAAAGLVFLLIALRQLRPNNSLEQTRAE